ncbi:hypothetical protein V5T82_01090 [Magnetovibrio sp. PR-2]|uniref:hypothetical protein n=1 Tax=Magnetovibrio sp. PR-2 TaxID=3120356 RepID=UPI002FCE1705
MAGFQIQDHTREQLERVHTSHHIEHIVNCAPNDGLGYLDADTVVSSGSIEAALYAAGFDAHSSDPQAQLRLLAPDYAWITHELVMLANECCKGRVVSMMEGGYDLHALASSVGVHVHILLTQ